MKKNLILLIVILALGFGAWFSWKRAGRKSTLEKLDLNFSVSDTASIDRIVIEPVNGGVSDLKRTDKGWFINEKFKVAPVLMDVLLSTVRNVEMLRPLARNEAQTALESMEKRGRKISIYVDGSLYKSYRLGDDAPGNKGTYIQLQDGDPYVAYLRGFNGFLGPRFDVDEYGWRDRLLINCSAEQIRSLSFSYKRMPSEGFSVEVVGRKISMTGVAGFDTAAVASLLSSFQKIYAERYLPAFPVNKADSLMAEGAEWVLELRGVKESDSKRIDMFPTSDPDRTLAYLPATKEWLTIQNRVLYPVMLRKSGLINNRR
jgi:hypothetical protein